jgi:ASC-1-like (ASCH) protein
MNLRNVPFVNSVKYLGEIFDKKVTWRLHIEIIEVKAFRTFISLYSQSKIERLLPREGQGQRKISWE